MSNLKLNIEAIAGIEEINDNDAANLNGGFDIELFYDRGFPETDGADGIGFDTSRDNLGSKDLVDGGAINNRTSSIRVNKGQWQVYSGTNFTGKAVALSPGTYDIDFLKGAGLHDNISSVKRFV